MVYKLFLYKSSAYNGGALAADMANRVLGSSDKKEWIDAEQFIENINYESVVNDLDTAIPLNSDGTKKYRCHKRYSSNQRIEYMLINTSFNLVLEIIDIIKGIALKHGLVLFDKNLEKSYFSKELEREQYVKAKKRAEELLKVIREREKPFGFILLEDCASAYNTQISYVVTIAKDGSTFEDRINGFGKLLSGKTVDDERFYCRDECFHIATDNYRITFVYEGYKKTADRVGYLKDGKPVAKLMYRMSCERAWKLIPSLGYKNNLELVYKSMRMEDLIYKYPNPADRLIAICKIRKYLRKFDDYAAYDPFPEYGGDVRMHKYYPDGFADDVTCSYLKIDEMYAMMFIPCVEKFYPYFKERYSLTNNYLPNVMCHDILKEAKRVRVMLASNPTSDESRKYLREGNCEWFLNDRKDFWKGIGLMDVFISWLELQMRYEEDIYRDYMVNITGP